MSPTETGDETMEPTVRPPVDSATHDLDTTRAEALDRLGRSDR